MNIRHAKPEDAGQIAEIYNYYILNTHHTFETEPLSAEEMLERVVEICESYSYLVAEENGEILGYVYATQFKLRQAYKHSVEASIYVKNQAKQKGIGSQLYEKLLAELAETDVHAIMAGISLPNEASVKFHEKLGYEKVAHFKEVGYKLGRWVDVGFWEMLNRF
ncbi:MAG: N-acetyltransferase family protein [Acidobacteriota bacterium]|nr:N-acetyltransferase family protein [Acidobacteriota bacterium]